MTAPARTTVRAGGVPGSPRRSVWGEVWRLLLAVVLGFAAVVVDFTLAEETGLDTSSDRFAVPFFLGLLVGLPAIGLLLARRSHPVVVGVALGLLASFSAMAAPAAAMALVSVATRKRWRGTVAVVGAWIVGIVGMEVVWPDPQVIGWTVGDVVLASALVVAVLAALVSVGVSIGNRRELLLSWQERARLLEAEQVAAEARARDHERSRMASEMHDVLGHQLSLVAVHAGALHTRRDLTDEEKAQSIAVVHERSRRALTELREVLGVLRSPSGEDGSRPQPSLDDLAELLVDDAVIEPDIRIDTARLPGTVSRHAYRILQECLTNARKHAPGRQVRVLVSGAPGDVLHLTVCNDRSAGPPADSSRGYGLLGIDERARSVGGSATVSSSPTEHRVDVVLPWPSS